jgi:hypothetical protein
MHGKMSTCNYTDLVTGPTLSAGDGTEISAAKSLIIKVVVMIEMKHFISTRVTGLAVHM